MQTMDGREYQEEGVINCARDSTVYQKKKKKDKAK